MNANAYGGELAKTLEWVEVATRHGGSSAARRPSWVRLSQFEPARRGGRRARLVRIAPRAGREGQGDARGDARAPPRSPAAGDQDVRLDLQESRGPTAGGRTAGLLLAEAGCNGLAVGGARFAPKHANFIENTGTATTAEVDRADGRGPPPRAGALRRGAGARGADARAVRFPGGRGLPPRSKTSRRGSLASPPGAPRRRPCTRGALRRLVGLARNAFRASPATAGCASALLAYRAGRPPVARRRLDVVAQVLVRVCRACADQRRARTQAARSTRRCAGAARGMSTLDVHTAALRAAVAPFRVVRRCSAARTSPTACDPRDRAAAGGGAQRRRGPHGGGRRRGRARTRLLVELAAALPPVSARRRPPARLGRHIRRRQRCSPS